MSKTLTLNTHEIKVDDKIVEIAEIYTVIRPFYLDGKYGETFSHFTTRERAQKHMEYHNSTRTESEPKAYLLTQLLHEV